MSEDTCIWLGIIVLIGVLGLGITGCSINRDNAFVRGGYCHSEVRGVQADVWVKCGGGK